MLSKEEIAAKHRSNFHNFMKKHNLTAYSWGRLSGVSEASIRHFLNGRSNSLSALSLALLAQSVGLAIDDLISPTTDIDHIEI